MTMLNPSPATTQWSIGSPERGISTGHAGIWRFGDKQVDTDDVARLTASLQYRDQVTGRPHIRRATTAIGRSAASDRALLTWAGRIDNRRELERATAGDLNERVAGDNDAQLLLKRYLVTGRQSFEAFVGDWSIAVLDQREHRLILATDFFGTKPLYFRRTSREIVWSSELATFLFLDQAIPPLDEEYLAGWLITFQPACRTPYRNVERVPPGHVAILTERGTTVERGWQPDPTRTIHLATDRDYDAHFLELFRDAVRHRLPSDPEPVWSELSGGLDSSSVTCIANELLRKTAIPQALTTVSYVFSESRSADESRYASLVESNCSGKAVRLDERDFPLLSCDGCTNPFEGPLPASGRIVALEDRMRASGARALLSGRGGDAVMWSQSTPRLDLLEAAGAWQIPTSLRLLRRYCVRESVAYWSLIKQGWMAASFRRTASAARLAHDIFGGQSAWIDWRAVATLLDTDVQTAGDLKEVPAGRRAQWLTLLDTVRRFATNDFRNMSRIDTRYPFLDRPLVEFMLAIPADQKRRPGLTRVLHRRALSSILPNEIVTRTWKAGATEPVMRAIRREREYVEALFRDSLVARSCSFVSITSAMKSIQSVADGQVSDFLLMRLISLEAWLQQLRTRLSAVTRSSYTTLNESVGSV